MRWRHVGILFVLTLTACATAHPGVVTAQGPGFVRGLADGLLAPISLVAGLFDDKIAFYSVPNSGIGYDFGFLLGICQWHLRLRFRSNNAE